MSGRRARRGKQEVSLAQRLGAEQGGTPPPPDGSVLPGEQPASRTERRQQRRHARRRRVWGLVVVVLVLAVVAGGVVWWQARDSGGGTAAGPDARTEQTVALVVADPQSPVEVGALLVADPSTGAASSLFVQNRLFVDGVSSESIPFGETTLLGNDRAPGDALAVTLDVLVDGTWRLSPSGLAALIDAVGPITVDVDVDVTERSGNSTKVVVASGPQQQLDGASAVAYATYRAPGEPEEARLARFSAVLSATVAALPDNPDVVRKALDELGAKSQSTVSSAEVASVLVTLGAAVRGDAARLASLPVTTLETGGPVPAYALDEQAFASVRSSALSGSLPPERPGGTVRVLVENGVGTPGIEQGAATMLRDAGFVFVNGGNANRFGYDKTLVLIPDSSAEQQALGASVARALHVPVSSVRLEPGGQQVAEVIVVLGADFDPTAGQPSS